MITLANPSALAWLLIVVPIGLVYFIRLRLRREVSAVDIFWQRVFARCPERPIHPARHWQSAIVQIFLVCLIVVAMAEPQWGTPRRIVLVIDNSAAMQLGESGNTALEQAKALAGVCISDIGPHEQMAVVGTAGGASVRCPMTGDRDRLQRVIDEITVTIDPPAPGEAIALAREALDGSPNGRIVFISGGAFDGADKLVDAEDVAFLSAAPSVGNVAVTRLAARRLVDDPGRCQILAEVTSFSDQPANGNLVITLEESGERHTLGQLPLTLEPDQRWHEVFETSTPHGGELHAQLELEKDDAVAEDNSRSTTLAPGHTHRVRIEGSGNEHLQNVLAAHPRVEIVSGETADDVIRIVHRRIPDTLPPGPVLVIDPRGPCDLWTLGDKLEEPVVAGQGDGSPLLAHVLLDGTQLTGASQLSPTPGTPARPLAWTAGGTPLLCAIERSAGRVLVLQGNLDEGSLPLREDFPKLIDNAIAWLAGDSGEWETSSESIGTVYDFRSRVDEGLESDGMEFAHPTARPLWPYLLAVAVLLLFLEWPLYQRRWIA